MQSVLIIQSFIILCDVSCGPRQLSRREFKAWAKLNPNVLKWVVQMTKFMSAELLSVADEFGLGS